jgi:hypothetical protein
MSGGKARRDAGDKSEQIALVEWDVASDGLGGDYLAQAAGFGWLPGPPFLEHREQRAPDHLVNCLAGVILFSCCEQGVE